ncbi:MAG TPA: winged helix-turn-helix domain-containing protein [Solirubrobacterales bacterium]|nr:winged helix-turn-helix domain-containing protein [Solirubrobacterales bacterium]
MVSKAAELHRDKRKRRREKKERRRVEEAVQYVLSHRFRVEILCLLNQASYTAGEVAELTGISLSNVANHIKRMLQDGAIEIAKIEERRGTNLYWYRAIEIPEFSQEEAERMTEMERQTIAGWVVQSGTAEAVAALWKGNLANPRTILHWSWYTFDKKGRADAEAKCARHLEEIREIEAESVNRMVESKEEPVSMIVSLFSFVRARKAPRPLALTEA